MTNTAFETKSWIGVAGALFGFWLGSDRDSVIDAVILAAAGLMALIAASDYLVRERFLDSFRWMVTGLLGILLVWGVHYTLERVFWEDRVKVGLRYAYEFQYRGATNVLGNEDRPLDPAFPVRVKYDPSTYVPFRFSIYNDNNGIPLRDAFLQILFPPGCCRIQIIGRMRVERTNERVAAELGTVGATARTPDGLVQVQFLQKGRHEFYALIDGDKVSTLVRPIVIVVE